jgi:sodium/potassium-transporting ATPase subunit beta
MFLFSTLTLLGKILLFYFIFYAVLAAFFMAMWFIFASTLVDTHPKYELQESIIGTNPGLGFRPMPPESNVESTLIWFEESKDNTKYWIDETKNFLSGKMPTDSN